MSNSSLCLCGCKAHSQLPLLFLQFLQFARFSRKTVSLVSVRAAVKLVYEYGKAIVAEESLFQLRSDLVVFREFKVSIEKSVEQSTF